MSDIDPRALEHLVGDWLSVPELAAALGIPDRQARRMIAEGEVLSTRIGPNKAVAVPTRFVRDGALLPALAGTITVLRDVRLTDTQALEWLFSDDPTLPIEGSPMTMLEVGRRAEVRKRASELAL